MTMTATNVNDSPTIFDERFGDIPKILFKAMRRFGVQQADFFLFESLGWDFQQMFDHILSHSTSGRYRAVFPL